MTKALKEVLSETAVVIAVCWFLQVVAGSAAIAALAVLRLLGWVHA